MRKTRWEPAILGASVFITLVLLWCCGCGGQHSSGAPQEPDQSAVNARALAETLRQLDALPNPAGADPQHWAELKDAFRRLLTKGKSKFSCQAPGSGRSQVDDLTVTAGGGGNADFNWTYRSEGDYNQNGVVGLDDLTPLGIHFGDDTTAADWDAAQVADGNRNGKIELGDLVSIGANYTFLIEGYRIQLSASGDLDGTWDTAAEAPFSSSSIVPGPWRIFSSQLAAAGTGFYRVVPYDAASEGIAGNIVYFSANPTVHFETEDNDDPPSADPLPPFPFPAPVVDGNLGTGNTGGDDNGDNVDWFSFTTTATGTVALDLSYTSADGDIGLYLYNDPAASPLDSSATHSGAESIEYTLPAGAYYVKCELASGFSEYALTGAFQVQPVAHFETEDNDEGATADALPAFPIAAGTVTGNLGAGNTQGDDDGDFIDWFSVVLASAGDLTLDLSHAVATGDLDLYLYDNPASDPLIISETDSSPEHIVYTIPLAGTYYIKCSRYTGFSEYVLDCAFVPGSVNNPPEAHLTATPLTGEAPLTVDFDASASTDPDAGDSITKYEFNFGDGDWFDSGADPTVTHVFNSPGAVTVTVRVTDSHTAADEESAPLNILPEGSGVWNVLIWMAADSNLATEAYGDIQRLESVGSTSTVRVLLGYDVASEWITGSGCEQVRFIRVVQDSYPDSINYTGDPLNISYDPAGYDSSNPQHVVEFLQWAAQFPSDHQLLILWDHGNGWREGWKEGSSALGAPRQTRGLLKDDADGTANLTNNEWIADILAGYHFDAVIFDACDMGHLEAILDYRNLADWVWVSEALLPGGGMPYDDILTAWNAQAPLGPEAICNLIGDHGLAMYSGVTPVTLATVDTTKVTGLVADLGALATAVQAQAVQERVSMRRAISLAYGPRAGEGERDLLHFLQIYRSLTADTALQAAADAVSTSCGQAIAQYRSYAHPGANGISVYLPDAQYFDGPTQAEYALTPFNGATGWLAMLQSTGVPGHGSAALLDANWQPGDKIKATWGDNAAQIDLSVHSPAGYWGSPVWTTPLASCVQFSADSGVSGLAEEWGELLTGAATGDYLLRLDWFGYSGTPPASLPVSVQLYDSSDLLKQDLGTCTLAPDAEANYVVLHVL
jgi:PKD repeat protein